MSKLRASAASRSGPDSGSSRPKAENGAQSLRDTAYEIIKERIITCAFKPGEYLNEASVSAGLGIGRTPVHQAIDRLMVDGLVEVIPRKGVMVKPLSLDELVQIIEMRLLNEVFCAKLAAERSDRAEIARLTDILRRTQEATKARDSMQMMRLDREFHDVLAIASRNPVLGEILARLHDRSLRSWIISLNSPGHHLSVFNQHHAILAAIRAHDQDAAQTAMRAHIEAFRYNIFGRLQSS
jgi:GntR family transcriptional regulator, rspAB operon transcriptional repressor